VVVAVISILWPSIAEALHLSIAKSVQSLRCRLTYSPAFAKAAKDGAPTTRSYSTNHFSLRVCFRDLGHYFAYAPRTIWTQMVFDQSVTKILEAFFRAVYNLEQLEIFG
jgi:hypothetical protein